MEIARKSCRLCLSETDFNVSLFGSYCRRTNMIDKILVCLRLPIEETEVLNTICHRCADNVERYYDFITYVQKAQVKLGNGQRYEGHRNGSGKLKHDSDVQNIHMNKRLVTSFVREQVYDADYTFSFLDTPVEEKKETKASSPFFSYFSPKNAPLKLENDNVWKTPQQKRRVSQRHESPKRAPESSRRGMRPERPRHHSRDLFDSQSQDVEDHEPRALDTEWKLTPDDNIIKRVREKCFGLSDF